MRQELFEPGVADAYSNGATVALHIAEDPSTGVVEFSLFTDDGRGNGNHLVTVKLADLLRIAAAYAKDR